MDRIYTLLKSRNGGVGRPEFRLRLYQYLLFVPPNNSSYCGIVNIVPGTILLPIGLLITGWAAQNRVFWLVPDVVRDLSCTLSKGR